MKQVKNVLEAQFEVVFERRTMLGFVKHELDGIDYCVRKNGGKILWFSADCVYVVQMSDIISTGESHSETDELHLQCKPGGAVHMRVCAISSLQVSLIISTDKLHQWI